MAKFVTITLFVLLFGLIHKAVVGTLTVKGIIAPVLVPTDEEGNLNFKIIPTYAKYLKDKGVDGILVSATVGEQTTLSVKDKKKLLDEWVKAAKPLKLKVMSQPGGIPLPDVKELAKYSESIGVDAILTLPELYFRPTTPEELVYFMKCVASAAPNTPLLYSHVPPLTNVEVDMLKFWKLATKKIPSFKGITVGDFETALLLRTKVKEDQRLFIANSSYLAPAVAMGFENFILGNVFPDLVMNIIEEVQNCELEDARANQEKVRNYKQAVLTNQSFYGVAAIKETMRLVTGINVGPPRAPIVPLTEKQKKQLKQALEEQGLKLKDSADEE